MSKYVIFQFVVSYTAKLSVWRTGDGAHSNETTEKTGFEFLKPRAKISLNNVR